MRAMIMAAACLLAACGASTESSDDVPDPAERALPLGPLVAYGETWTLTASPADNAVSFSADDGTESTSAWTPPVAVDGGYRLSSGDMTLELREGACAFSPRPSR